MLSQDPRRLRPQSVAVHTIQTRRRGGRRSKSRVRRGGSRVAAGARDIQIADGIDEGGDLTTGRGGGPCKGAVALSGRGGGGVGARWVGWSGGFAAGGALKELEDFEAFFFEGGFEGHCGCNYLKEGW